MKSSINKIIKHKFVLYTSVNVAVFVVFFKAILNFLNFFSLNLVGEQKKRTRQTYKNNSPLCNPLCLMCF